MKRYVGLILSVLALLALTIPVFAVGTTWNVDIGDTTSESSVVMSGWGVVEPATHGGGWGGIDDCRVVWENTAPGVQGEPEAYASVTYTYSECVVPTSLALSALDGQATDDGYTVEVDGVLVFTYLNQVTSETWFPQVIDLTQFALPNSKVHVVEICATGMSWSAFATYGQVAIDYVDLTTIPCEGNTELDVDFTVIEDMDCICIDVSPASIDFGDLKEGDTKTIVDAFTITNCGNVAVEVTATTDNLLYETNLYFDNVLAEGTWWDAIPVGSDIEPDAKIVVPDPYALGSVSGAVVFWAELASP